MKAAFEYVIKKIIDALIIKEPYPHILISGIFPDEFYSVLLEQIPKVSAYTPKTKYGKTMTLENFDILDEEKKKFWKEVYGFLRSAKFASILLKKFNISKNGVSDLFLHKDLENFEFRPHRDTHSKLVTYLFYLPEDSSLSQLGTHMLVPKKGVVIKKTTEHQDWELFETVKMSEYVPNSFFAFAPHENSFHAVKIDFPEDSVKKRDTIRGFVFNKDAEDYPEYLFGK
jgi:hypothetical protein